MKVKFLCVFLLFFLASLNAAPLPYPYFVRICHDPKFIQFIVPKAGHSTIASMLHSANIQTTLFRGNINLNDPKWKSYFKFTFVRNPWDRAVSAYINLIQTKQNIHLKQFFDKDFNHFIKAIATLNLDIANVHIRKQSVLVPKEVDFIGRFENFSEDLSKILNKIGLEGRPIPHVNKSDHLHYSHYYNRNTRQIIAKKYKEEIKAFGYRFVQE